MAKARTKKEGYIDLEMVITREGKQYSSWCPVLDVASCGDTPDEAAKNLCDAIGCYLEALTEDWELGKVLEEKGIQVVRGDEPAIPNSFISPCRQKLPTLPSHAGSNLPG